MPSDPAYRPPPPGSPTRTLPNSRSGPVVPEGPPPSTSTLQKASASKAFLENHYRSMIRDLRRIDQAQGTSVTTPPSLPPATPPVSPSHRQSQVTVVTPSPPRTESAPREASPVFQDPADKDVLFVSGGFGGVTVESCSEGDSSCDESAQRPSGRVSSPPTSGRPSAQDDPLSSGQLGRRASRQTVSRSFVKIGTRTPGEEPTPTSRTASVFGEQNTTSNTPVPGSLAATIVRPRQRDIRPSDFNLLKIVGRGAFGEVFICTKKQSSGPGASASLSNTTTSNALGSTVTFLGDSAASGPSSSSDRLYAMKRMRKIDMLKKKQVFHVRSERNVLAEAAADNPWIVQLHYSFQDDQHLYMVTDYLPGGDLMSWLISEQIFTVAQTRFYIAELCAAIHSVHDMNYVHRDIKPDNILIDDQGHIRLSDFGLCKKFALPSKQARQKWLERHERRALKKAQRMLKRMKDAANEEERQGNRTLDPEEARAKKEAAREYREAAERLQQQLNAERLPAGYEPPTSSPVNVGDDAASETSEPTSDAVSDEDLDFFAPTPQNGRNPPSGAGSTAPGVSPSQSAASSHFQGRTDDDVEVDLYEEDELLPTTIWRPNPNLEDSVTFSNSIRGPVHHRVEHFHVPASGTDASTGSVPTNKSPNSEESPGKNFFSESERQHDIARATMKDAIRRRQKFQSIVGSPGYIAPEILLRQQYGVNCDYWSVGVIMYEMLFGYPPFYSENPQSTCDKIVRWRHFLRFPREQHPHVPKEAIDLIRHLLCDAPDRYEFEQIKNHPFFACVNWDTLRFTTPQTNPEMLAPFSPQLSHPTDTRYFPELEEINALYGGQQAAAGDSLAKTLKEEDPRGVMFADFKYRRD